MRLKISHRTEYLYDVPVSYALQRVRLVPQDGRCQRILNWALSVEGAAEEVRFNDHFGNDTRLLSLGGEAAAIVITAAGEVETSDNAGVVGPHRGFAPLWLFLPQTERTLAGDGIAEISAAFSAGKDLDRLHGLMDAIHGKVAYEVGATDVGTTAEEALERGSGVCQDHAHIFLAAARSLGFPARYVSGYMMVEGTTSLAASHAWAEAHVDGLGWVGFDVANAIAPDDRYVKIAVGRDYRDAMPVSGIRLGTANERLAVDITVEQ